MRSLRSIILRNLTTVALMTGISAAIGSSTGAQDGPAPVGLFEGHSDVGTVLHPGTVDYDTSQRTYTISGSGENMWFAADAFQFAWKKVSGDVTLAADISFLTTTGNEHKKAALMLRQSLDADSVYADVALHASGLTSLQFRDEKGAITREIQANISAPKRLRIARRGDYVYMSLAADGEPRVSGGWLRIPLQGTFYVGLGVCSHDKDVVEKAVFSNVELTQPASAAGGKPTLYSTLETVAIDSADRRVAYLAPGRFEAPNWTHDGSAFLFNRDGHIERLAVGGDKPVVVDTGFANRCNNDHGLSPDAIQIAISDNSQGDHNSLVYIVPITGGTPRRITQNSPSYWHGWSPDGKTLAFVGQRNGDFDIYAIPAAGGEEKRLTTAKGLDDGPEYSPDGKYIYFNSERTGHMPVSYTHLVRVVPVAWPGIRLQTSLKVENRQHSVRAATAVRPLARTCPLVGDITRGTPQIPANFLAPQPGLRRAPFANAQHDGSPRRVKSRADVGIGCLRVLRGRVAPVVL